MLKTILALAVGLVMQKAGAQWTLSQIGAGRFVPVSIYHMNTDGEKVFFIANDTSFISHSQAIYLSNDNGQSFDYLCRLSLNWGSAFYAATLNSDSLLIVTTGGIMKKGLDSISGPEYIVRFSPGGQLYKPHVVFWGDSGRVIARHTYKTFDKGETWVWDSTKANPPRLLTVEYIPESGRMVTRDSKTIYASKDLGLTWDLLKDWSTDAQFNIGSLTMANDTVGYFYDQGSLYKTTNGGTEWNVNGHSPPINSLKFISESYGFRLVQGQKQVAVTTDGKNWNTDQLLSSASRYSDRLYYFNDSNFFLTNNGNIYKRSRLSLGSNQAVHIAENTVVVYPNPVVEAVTVDLPEGITGFAYGIYNVLGDRLNAGYSPGNYAVVSFGGLPPGVYILVITVDGRVFQKRICKE